MEKLNLIEKILVWALPVIFAITIHEAAHGFVANKLGDDTAKRLGRITANPLKHIELVGTIIVPLILLATTNFIFGWAKPVPVDMRKLRKPKKHMAIVAIAGPLSNGLMAVFWILFLKLSLWFVQNDYAIGMLLAYMGQAGIVVNLILMILNLFPIPPLDGSKVLSAFLPDKLDKYYSQASLLGLMIVIALAATGVLGEIMFPIFDWMRYYLFLIFGLA
ncbi:site-2 protease family protein [Candidatus Berkiella cookevillensis]|uniref:Peptidase family M50 n=1 Tax=Candidatus Berkiella cookevillensis TaxID=437022 RepID=A0A0Q9YT74_9GAMM|nr:site-2 protease family protein [Candidatus Berkiella cookevillensis]MCS5708572.1 site-2 protease family protein [Candidatus Berkiella cookevillensis]